MAKENFTQQLKEWRRTNAENYAKTLMSPPRQSSLMKTIPDVGVCLIMGHRDKGKTGLAHEIAWEKHEKRGKDAVLHLPDVPVELRKKLVKLLPAWFTITTHTSQWPVESTVVFDEAAQTAHARRSMSGDSVDLDNLISISRQRNQLILPIAHHSRKLDLNVVTELDRILWKKPTHGHAVFERDEMTDFAYKALQYFQSIKGDTNQKKMTLALNFEDFQYFSFKNRLPPYWNDTLSRIFMEIDLEVKGKNKFPKIMR